MMFDLPLSRLSDQPLVEEQKAKEKYGDLS
jgi:hypothetical protein